MMSSAKTKPLSFILFAFLASLLALQSSLAATDSTLKEIKARLGQAGSYRFVYRMFFKLYDASFYTDAAEITDIDSLFNGENTVLLEFDYLRQIKKSIILESSEKILANNMTPVELASIQERVDQINAKYKTVTEGDRSALSYVPGEGTTLWINGEQEITIEGNDFARLYFRIWLGERPISKQMRDELLKRIFEKR